VASSGITSVVLVLVAAALGVGLITPGRRYPEEDSGSGALRTIPEGTMTTVSEIPPGRPGNLTADQEEKLKRMWTLLLKVCQVGQPENGTPDGTPDGTDSGADAVAPKPAPVGSGFEKTHKKKRSFFSRRRGATELELPAPGAPTNAGFDSVDQDDKYGQTKQFYDTLASQTPDSIRAAVWSMVKHDNPDALLLRFLRARKWDVDKALVMMISTMNWRATEMHVDSDIMTNGEGGAALAEKGENVDPEARQMAHDFLAQMRMGKSFLHGADKAGRPICFVRVRLHRQGEHLERALERNTVYLIETARLLLQPPVDTAVRFASSTLSGQKRPGLS
jgi:hypothetical protein